MGFFLVIIGTMIGIMSFIFIFRVAFVNEGKKNNAIIGFGGLVVAMILFAVGENIFDNHNSYEYKNSNDYYNNSSNSSGSNVNFKGKHCTGTVGCDCSGFSPITDGDEWQKSYCRKCGHHKKYHK